MDLLSASPSALHELHQAMNSHDLEAFVTCFASDYRSEQPFHPDRNFIGSEQVRKNWARMFEGIPNFESDLLRWVNADETLWTEWDWHGTRTDGTPFHVLAVIVFGIREERFAWGRLYMEPVEAAGAGYDLQLQAWTGIPAPDA